ncbi:hypothetical protein JCGZ_23874 [Jatropha curcas]|uniref:EGF-like domain-containing protein n=1 Tax=Jatropha curcas TaxID=180498 RepID=A0A067L3C9_JATCU|nr:hypothetical protein JCGZ_23874 [Jatropha curcas]
MLAFWFVILPLISQTTTATDVISGCPDTCGTVHVPYPFGINFTSGIPNPNCALNSFFMFICNARYDPPRLFFGENMPIHDISVEEGTISVRIGSAYNCYNETGFAFGFYQSIYLGNGPFRFSDTRNKLTAIGCDTLALMRDAAKTFGSGCVSLCDENVTLQGSCSGFGCCQTSVPQSLKTLTIRLASQTNHSSVWRFNPCEFAFLADERTFNVSKLQLSALLSSRVTKQVVFSDVVIEWVVREESCEAAQSSSNSNRYACGSNSNCTNSENGKGYRCICKDGFTGNPYLPQGCQDIDECKELGKYKCDGSCKNTIGSYKCSCPFGMRGDGKVGCQGFRITTIAAREKPNSSTRSGEKSNIVQYFLSSLENNELSRILCFDVASETEMEEIEVFAELAKQCVRVSGMKRPTMKQVSEELGRLRKLHERSGDYHQNSEETEHLLGQSSYRSIDIGTAKLNQQEVLSLTTFDVEYSTGSI